MYRAGEDHEPAGFTLLELVCVLALTALLASILLPHMPHGTSRLQLEAVTLQIAALLKGDHVAAQSRGRTISALVDVDRRMVRSGSDDKSVRVPDDVIVKTVLPEECAGRPVISEITFFGSGMSCGGTVVLKRQSTSFAVRVNWLTGEIRVANESTYN
jgi:general secretion pathway protein H